jgi:uncharacterized membrane protein
MREPLRWLLAAFMVAIGVLHFVAPANFVRIVPAWLPHPLLLVHVSGVAEIAGGVGIVCPWPRLRRAAAWGLVLLYVAVFPANINQAVNQIQFEGQSAPGWLFWLRLPFQALFIAWAHWYTRPERPSSLDNK